MKKIEWSVQLKKQFIILLHLIFLGLTLTGFSFIYLNSNYGRGLSWIHEESYADTFSFKELLEDDIEKIFQYVNYKDVFETDGQVDYSKDMVSATFNSGKTVVYTLDDLVRYARSMGYYLNDAYEVAGGPASVPAEDVATPLINWKVYNPDEKYSEPGDAYASLESLSKEVLTLLGEYYRIENNYVSKPSNLYFQVFYMDDSNEGNLYSNASERTVEELKQLGRYLYISGDSILMDTNMKHVPDNITSLLEKYNLYNNDNYHIIIALDTSYPFEDDYSIANHDYLQVRIDYITGLVLLGIGLAGCLLTIFSLAGVSGYKSHKRSEIRLHGFDRLPLELSLVFFLLALYGAELLAGKIGYRFLHLVVDNHYWYYSERLLVAALSYLCCLVEAFSLLRCYKARTLWSNSLLCRIYTWISRYLTGTSYPLHLTVCFLSYLVVNGLLIAIFSYLYIRQELLSFPLFYLVPAAAILAFNIWVFLVLLRGAVEDEKISQALYTMASGDTGYQVELHGFSGKKLELAETINNISSGLETALQEKVKSERLKADLITNVSHDIKTPLTSIINYVDLIKREKIPDEKIQKYLEVLDQKSQRLKTLTDDLVEASKASSGNLKLEISDIDIVELVQQTNGEFEEKFELRHLELVSHLPDETIIIEADGRRLWRVLENLYNNAFKYAMEHSRIYVDVLLDDGQVLFTIKNISANPLNIHADELTERFVRGDVARTTEGSGLGLSIAKSLTELQNGTFTLYIDGDLFKAQVAFPLKQPPSSFH